MADPVLAGPRPYSHWMLSRARRATKGVCVICGPSIFARSWVEGSGARLCSAHTSREQLQALAALRDVDAEAIP